MRNGDGSTYHLYIQPVEDNAGNTSGTSEYKFGEYKINDTSKVQTIILNKNDMKIHIGEKDNTLEATVIPEEASTVEWSSNYPNIVSVDRNTGELTALSKGTARITATAVNGGKNASCNVKVIVPIDEVAITASKKKIKVGESLTLQKVISPENASVTNIEWTTTSNQILEISNGVVRGISKGNATITLFVTDEEDNVKTATYQIEVEEEQTPEPPVTTVTDVRLNKNKLMLHNGAKEKLIANILPSDASDILQWSSNNPTVINVQQDGTVTAINVGTATITVKTSNGKKDTCEVTSMEPILGVSISGKNKVFIDSTVQLSAINNPTNASILRTEWSSNKESVATVDNNGIVKGVSEGIADITVKVTDLEGTQKTAKCTMQVEKNSGGTSIVPITWVKLSEEILNLNINETYKLNFIILPENQNTSKDDEDPNVEDTPNNGDKEEIKTQGEKSDKTTANTALPKAGIGRITLIIGIIIIFTIFIIKKYIELKDVK